MKKIITCLVMGIAILAACSCAADDSIFELNDFYLTIPDGYGEPEDKGSDNYTIIGRDNTVAITIRYRQCESGDAAHGIVYSAESALSDYETYPIIKSTVNDLTVYEFLFKSDDNTKHGEYAAIVNGSTVLSLKFQTKKNILMFYDAASIIDSVSCLAEPDTEPVDESELTISQQNALKQAERYLEYTAFSKSGLQKQLEFEGYSEADAAYAAEHCGADWKEQAAAKAEQYLEYSSFSRSGLIDQLLYEGFTQEEAEYGVSAVGY